LAGIAGLWARAGNYPVAFQTIDSIRDSDKKGAGLVDVAGTQAIQGDVAAALQTAARIPPTPRYYNHGSWARLNISDAQLSAGDIVGALETVGGIQYAFAKVLAKQRIADAQTEAGDPASALQTLGGALRFTDNIEEPLLKYVIKQKIAASQAKAGDIVAALRTADGIQSPFEMSSAKQNIAETQAKSGDPAGAQQTLTAALAAADKVQDKSIVMQAYAEAKARIDTGTPGNPNDQPTVAPPTPASAPDWVLKNDTLLNTPFFLNLAAYLKTLPKDDSSKIMESLEL